MKAPGWLREPLVHFLIAGVLLYFGASLLSPVPEAGHVIVVDDDALATRLLQQTGTTDRQAALRALQAMPAADRQKLVRETAADEALWREGRALGLDTVDGVVRMRTIQQMRQVLTQEAASDISVGDAEVRKFYQDNKAAYAEPASASFSHLFFAGPDGKVRAGAALARLRKDASAQEYGDRFLYQTNYADAGTEELAGQFGIGFVQSLLALQPGPGWQGPVKSDHGWHLVQLRELTPANVPAFEEIEGRVREDAMAAKRNAVTAEAVAKLLGRYEVRAR
ncbi:peptidylprolyl isomerase [Croceibacterium aestuarii]|uniref:peptidylprolyl isomerase n=1 Tax=Croceibacterium aestuarii TaxID=3064139 RepID=UPI00272DEB3A|nr:peptidylprolyl isomerase [Croceibacterium sp. D39]